MRIINFYTSDEYSRQLPGMKTVKSVKQPSGKRLKIQKDLLLINIKELYAEYKKKIAPLALCASFPSSLTIDLYTLSMLELAVHTPCVYVFTTKT